MTIMRFFGLFIVVVAWLGLMAMPLKAAQTIVFSDDFEDDTIGNNAPNAPPVGDSWHEYYVGSTMREIAANPESEARNTSSKALYMSRVNGQTSTHSHIQAMISAADQAMLEEAENVVVEYKYYDAGAVGSYSYGLSANANIGGPSYHSPWAANISLRDVGGSLGNTIRGSGEAYCDLTYEFNTWHDFRIDIDLAASTYTVTVDGVMQSDANGDPAFYNGDSSVSTIDNILWSPGYYPCNAYIDDVVVWTDYLAPIPGDINGDGYVDDIDATILAANWHRGVPPGSSSAGSVPEPGSIIGLFSMGLFGGLYCLMRRKR